MEHSELFPMLKDKFIKYYNKKLSDEEIAYKLGITQSTVSRWAYNLGFREKNKYCTHCKVPCRVCGAKKDKYECPKCLVYGDLSSGRFVSKSQLEY